MRYIKVLCLVLLFFFVMMFFVQNHDVFSHAMSLKLDLVVIPGMESSPMPFYTLLLLAFLIGALCSFGMLVFDRVSMTAKLAKATMTIRSLEKELKRKGGSTNESSEIEDAVKEFDSEEAKK